jgi:hypothetical protein
MATAQGICRGSRMCVPPAGMMPQRTSPRPKVAFSDAMRRSVPWSISRPPAMQWPFTAPMIGLKTSENCRLVWSS